MQPDQPEMIPAGEVCRLLGVHPKTVKRWANEGKLRCIKTPGGHRRFFRSEILALIQGTDRGGDPL